MFLRFLRCIFVSTFLWECFKKLYRICNVQGFTYCGNFGNPRHLFCIMQKPSISIFKVPFPFFMVNYPTRVWTMYSLFNTFPLDTQYISGNMHLKLENSFQFELLKWVLQCVDKTYFDFSLIIHHHANYKKFLHSSKSETTVLHPLWYFP